jgi:phospholipase/carboxylesterase
MTAFLPHITLETGKKPEHCVIWLHGLGADGNDFVPVVDELNLPVPTRFVFPHAPQRPVTINGGYVMRAWYDIAGQTIDAKQDEQGIRESQAAVEQLIALQRDDGIPASNIVLAGFSQGGAIALQTALRQAKPLSGVLALSTYLPLSESAASEARPESRVTPIFMAHGVSDPVVPYALGNASRSTISALGYAVEWHEYPMQHSVCDAELRDIEHWLGTRLAR